MSSHEILARLRGIVEEAESTAEAMNAELARRIEVIQALLTLIQARADLAKAGWALVPLEPTEAMIEAGAPDYAHPGGSQGMVRAQWRAMIAASANEVDPAGRSAAHWAS